MRRKAVEAEVVKARLAGVSREKTAARFDMTIGVVDSIMRDAKREGYLEKEVLALTWRERLKDKSIDAVEGGLTCLDDLYKRADIGVKVLKGLGEFTESLTGLHLLVTTVPSDWKTAFQSPTLPSPLTGEQLPPSVAPSLLDEVKDAS